MAYYNLFDFVEFSFAHNGFYTWAKKVERKEVRNIILNEMFWLSLTYAIKLKRPLVQVLKMEDAEKKKAMGLIYNVMSEAKELIKYNLGGDESNNKEIWKIIDEK